MKKFVLVGTISFGLGAALLRYLKCDDFIGVWLSILFGIVVNFITALVIEWVDRKSEKELYLHTSTTDKGLKIDGHIPATKANIERTFALNSSVITANKRSITR